MMGPFIYKVEVRNKVEYRRPIPLKEYMDDLLKKMTDDKDIGQKDWENLNDNISE